MDKFKDGVADIHENIRKLLKDRKNGLKAYEICDKYFILFNRRYSDSSMTARMREMKDVSCNLSTHRYSLNS